MSTKNLRLVVGIGASVGGLAAFKSFLANTPANIGLAIVLVQHLAPDHKSLLVELLAIDSPLPVVTASEGMSVEQNHVYVIPPDATLTIVDGVLHVVSPAPARSYRRPIDSFFASLAEDQRERAVGIVLAGVGDDGSLGIRAIKDSGGMTLAQAEFDHHAKLGMPHSAAATGMVDFVLPVEAMPKKLVDYVAHLSNVAVRKDQDGTRTDIRARLSQITALLQNNIKHDFSGYKESTLVRRMQRRIQMLQLHDVDAYIDRLQNDPDEANVLFREVLIGVTEFFRDPEAFTSLKDLVIRPILQAKRPNASVRIWIAGCSTGEEVYSLAILLKETMLELNQSVKIDVKIFGTDIDAGAINAARAGRYRKGALGLSAERLARWFSEDGGDLCPQPEIRDMCVFSEHSLIKDPPFSRLDLISCRNLLIYLDNDLQTRAIRTFHYALGLDGYLFLGTSEGIGRHGSSFAVLDKKHRIFQRIGGSKSVGLAFEAPAALTRPPLALEATTPISATPDDRLDKSVRRVMDQYAPAYFVIDRQHDILRFSGSETRHYLEPSPGAASLHLFTILHKTLRSAVRSAVQRALSQQETVVIGGLSIAIDGKTRALTLIVEPILESLGREMGVCIVAFRDTTPIETVADLALNSLVPREATTTLEKELQSTRFQLRVASDELETTIEDAKSANEEFQAVNEELQSSNEELETAKEEMQSINEELQTVNGELASKNDLLTRLNSDLQNLLDSTQIATVFLDDDLCIRHFTPALTSLFPVRESDRGRPITEIVNLLSYDNLKRDIEAVQASRSVVQHEVSLKSGKSTYLLRIQPYRTVAGVVDGVVLTFVDISDRKRAEEHALLLSNEVLHRTGNLLAVINSIASRTFTDARPMGEAKAAFFGRLTAIARAQALLTEKPGVGGQLDDIVRSELQHFSQRVTSNGPLISLTPVATQGFALIVHELTTNAIKYGALQGDSGAVSVVWLLAESVSRQRCLQFRWRECGGPSVKRPTREGFGSTLLRHALDPSKISVVVDYAAEGLTYDLDVVLSSICTDERDEKQAALGS